MVIIYIPIDFRSTLYNMWSILVRYTIQVVSWGSDIFALILHKEISKPRDILCIYYIFVERENIITYTPSMTTATPAGWMAWVTAMAICFVNRSWTWIQKY